MDLLENTNSLIVSALSLICAEDEVIDHCASLIIIPQEGGQAIGTLIVLRTKSMLLGQHLSQPFILGRPDPDAAVIKSEVDRTVQALRDARRKEMHDLITEPA